MFQVRDGQIWWGTGEDMRIVGPQNALLCAPKELATLNEREGILHPKPPVPLNIDGVFAIGDRVAGIESKKVKDLVTSHQTGRLGRQLSTLIEQVDIPILLRRGFDLTLVQDVVAEVASRTKRWRPSEFWADMNVRYAALGIWVIDVPDNDVLVREWLLKCKEAWLGEPARAVVRREGEPRERAPGWWLRRIPGIGMKISQDMHEKYGSTYLTMKAARGGDWGHSEKLRVKIEEASS